MASPPIHRAAPSRCTKSATAPQVGSLPSELWPVIPVVRSSPKVTARAPTRQPGEREVAAPPWSSALSTTAASTHISPRAASTTPGSVARMSA